jgi:putative DNA methylase
MAKWIENGFPFAQLSQIAEHESWRKEVHRPVYYLHKWWARRLGSVFRGLILGVGLDDNEDLWQHFYGQNDCSRLTVFDPFMGSGVTIGEAVKLGCRAIGRDINPVAVTACVAAFALYDPAAVHETFRQIERTAAPSIRRYFATRTDEGEQATVLYYFLVKTIACPACAQTVELFKRRLFSANATPSKDPSARAVCPACGAINHTRYDATAATCSVCQHVYDPQAGNVHGAQVKCPHCQASFKLVEQMKTLAGPLPYRRYAKLMLLADGSKRYAPLNAFDRALEQDLADEARSVVASLPAVPVPAGYNTDQMIKHNYRFWHELFSDRQIVGIAELMAAIQQIEDPHMKRLFACLFSGTLEFNNLFASFKGEGTGAVRHMFAHHVLKPELMPIEANLWGTSKSSGSFSTLYRSRVLRALKYKQNPTEVVLDARSSIGGINRPLSATVVPSYQAFSDLPGSIYLSQGDSSHTDIPAASVDAVIADPPFFDNVHYSQLADFFYYWLNQIIPAATGLTTRHPGEVQDTSAEQFTDKLTTVFAECRRVLKDEGLFIFTYHHARQDGWTAVHRAVRHAGFVCVQAYPIKAEMSVAVPLQQAKSPIHLDLILVCRKSLDSSPAADTATLWRAAVEAAEQQTMQLREADIDVSLGDAKVVLMGHLLRQAHRLRSLDAEEAFLVQVAHNIDDYVAQVLATRGEVLYAPDEALQLALFEQMAEYASFPT